MSDYNPETEVIEHSYDVFEVLKHTEDNVDNSSEVLHESDTEGFGTETKHNYSETEEEERAAIDRPHSPSPPPTYEAEETPLYHEKDNFEQTEEKYEEKYEENYDERIVVPNSTPSYEVQGDENDNHAHTKVSIPTEEEMGSAKKAFVEYEAALKKKDDGKGKINEDDAERAELAKKKKVNDLIARFNTGAVYNQSSSSYKNDYGATKIGTVKTSVFK